MNIVRDLNIRRLRIAHEEGYVEQRVWTYTLDGDAEKTRGMVRGVYYVGMEDKIRLMYSWPVDRSCFRLAKRAEISMVKHVKFCT